MKKLLVLVLSGILCLPAKSQVWEALQEGIPNLQGVRVMYADSVDNYLYAGGGFYYQSNGKQFNSIARWDGTAWDTMGTGIYGAGNVLIMARYNGELYVGGAFDSAGSKSARNITRWNGFAWDTIPGEAFRTQWADAVFSLDVISNELYVGGVFDSIAGMPCRSLAKWNDTNWTCIGMPSNMQYTPYVFATCVYNGELYVGGNFNSTAFPNDTIMDIVRYDGVNWKSVGGGMYGLSTDIASMVVYNGELYVAGYFFQTDGNAGNHIQKWNGTAWSDVGGGTNLNNGQINKLIVHDGKLYAIGVLQAAGGVPADRIAVWDGIRWCGLGSTFENTISTGCIYKDTLHVGGGFWTIDGDSVNHIAKWIGGSYVDTCSVVGINDIADSNNGIKVYPNPVSDNLTIEFSAFTSEKKYLSIYNVLGERMLKSQISNPKSQIDVSELASGIYFAEVQSGKNILRKKFVKE